MTDSMQPEYLSLIKLLDKRLFDIPEYQRSYSWSKRQRDDLFKDIENLAEEDGTSHFMATVVCLRHRDEVKLGTNKLAKLDIVDGQQRLTTLIILLNAIRHALNKEDEEQGRTADELEALLVKRGSGNLLLLQTNHDSSRFFYTYLHKGTAPKPKTAKTLADQNLLSAIDECKRFVDDWVESDRTLIDLTFLIKNQLMFVLHQTSEEKTVYRIFEVINSRGIPVACLDRLKSIVMGLAFTLEEDVAREHLIDHLHKTWRDIYLTIGLRPGLDTEALRFAATLYLESKQATLLSDEEAVDALRGCAGDSAESIRAVADWVLATTQACQTVSSNPRQGAVTRIVQVRLLGVALHMVLNEEYFSDEETSKLLETWEKISFRIYGLHDKDARTRVGDYCKLAWEVMKEEGITAEDVDERIRRIGSEYGIDEGIDKLRRGFAGHGEGERKPPDCYSGWSEQLRYLLFRYEEHLAEERGQRVENNHWKLVWAKKATLSIEHIRPRSEAPDDIKHTLGNLMLLPSRLNSKLKDRSPKRKAQDYRRTGFHHAVEVADMLDASPKWSRKTCARRQRKILDWAREEWGDKERT